MASFLDRPPDIISCLPGNIIETILLRLPIRDAVRTSILSRKWRYSWITLPELVFDDTFCQALVEKRSSAKIASAIYQVLLLHHGPILNFTFSMSGLASHSEIDQSILFLSRNGVEVFNLSFYNGDPYKLPASLFSCINLRSLFLRFCVFKPPPGFKGFSRLKILVFSEVIVARKTIESLISSCPLLEELTMDNNFPTLDYLEINAPNLRYLCAWEVAKSICFKNAPFLTEVSISTSTVSISTVSDLINLFGSLPVIENLEMNYHFIKSWSAGDVPNRLSTTLIHLKVLSLYETSFENLDDLLGTLCLITSSPALTKITITVYDDTNEAVTVPAVEFLEVQHHYPDIVLQKLQEVKIKNACGTMQELEFIKFLLAKSPVLETMLIEPKSMKAKEALKMSQKMIRFQRSSADAEIILKDPEL